MWFQNFVTNSQSKFNSLKFADISESEEMDFSTLQFADISESEGLENPKEFASSKYRRRRFEQKSTTKIQYDELVDKIKEARKHRKYEVARLVKDLDKVKKQVRKERKRIVAMSGKTTLPFLDMLNAMIDLMKQNTSNCDEGLIKVLLDLSTVIFNVFKNSSWDSVLVNFSSFFMRNFPIDKASIALQWFKDVFKSPQAQGTNDTWGEWFLSLFGTLDNIAGDAFWDLLQDFIVKITLLWTSTMKMITIESLDIKTILSKFKEFRSWVPAAKDIFEIAIRAFQFIAAHWDSVISGNWNIFCFGRTDAQAFEIEVRKIEQAAVLALSGQEIELKRVFNLDLESFEVKVGLAVKQAEKLMLAATSPQIKMALSTFHKKLYDIQAALWSQKADVPSKAEAYAIKMSGPSSCGKSTMIRLISKTILKAYDRDPNESGTVVFTNIDEKFESTILPSHRIIVADDVANNKNSRPNYDRLLNYVNTVPRPLEKADCNEKGKFFPGNDALIVTTNDQSIRATECSVCPESILRRFALDVRVEIRDEFKNSFGGLKRQDGLRFDVYRLTLMRFQEIAAPVNEEGELCGPPEIVWDVIPRSEWNPFDDDEHDFHALCAFIAKDIRIHKRRQEKQKLMQDALNDCGFCEKCKAPKIVCACIPEDLKDDDHISAISLEEPLEEPLEDTEQMCEVCFTKGDAFCHCNLESNTSSDTLKSGAVAMAGGVFQHLSTSQLWDLRNSLVNVKTFINNTYRNLHMMRCLFAQRKTIISSLAMLLGLNFLAKISHGNVTFYGTLSIWMFLLYRYRQLIKQIDEELSNRNDFLSSLYMDISQHLQANAMKYFKIAGAIFALYGCYKILRPLYDLRSQDKSTYLDMALPVFDRVLAAPPPGRFEITQHEFQDLADYKEGYSRLPPKSTNPSKTTTSKDLQDLVMRSLRVVIVKSKGENYGTVNGIMVASNVIMVPSHIIPNIYPFDIETTSVPGVPSAVTKDQKLTEDHVYIDRERDHAFIHLASSPASKDLSKFFPLELPTFRARSTCLLWKSPSGEIKKSFHASRPNVQPVHYAGFLERPGYIWGSRHQLEVFTIKPGYGLEYNTEFQGFGGLCGSLLLDADLALIYGFHVAGIPNSTQGWSTCVIKKDIDIALAALHKSSPALLVHSTGDIEIDKYGTPYSIVNAKPHYLRDDGLKEKAKVTFIGKVLKDGGEMVSAARTPYIPTPFKNIATHLGKCEHRPPKDPNEISKGMSTLNKLHDPVQNYEGDILSLAVNDYLTETLECFKKDEDLQSILRIYTQDEAMNGIGEFGLGGIPNDTSAGFPISKSKKKIFKRDPLDETLVQIPREFNDSYDIQSEIDKTFDAWRNGERSEPIYKASSKVNELLPHEKACKKVRKFYGSPVANLIASRQVLAGVNRIMHKHWKTTECYVGINATSNQWQDLHDHLTEYSSKNMFAGDFAGFDTRMSAQITGAAAKIIVEWYRCAGLSEDDLKLVKGCLSDIIHPNILFDGDLYRFANGNPSGNLITVQLNSICNSLMMRYVYYSQMPKIRERFAQNVRLATYGDDNVSAVKNHCRWYNHTSCQREFEKLDISYTMADKDSESTPYITISDVSFLKRTFVHHKELNCIVAPLEEASIKKCFHWIKKPTETPLSFTEQFGAYTDVGQRSMYLHGREKYNQFQDNLRAIMEDNPELKGVIFLVPYDEMTLTLKPAYQKSFVYMPKDLFAESTGVDDLIDIPLDVEVKINDSVVSTQNMSVEFEKSNHMIVAVLGMCVQAFLFVEIKRWLDAGGKDKLLSAIKLLIDNKRKSLHDQIDETYQLNGVDGVSELLMVPTFIAEKVVKYYNLA